MERRNVVLEQMVKYGYLGRQDADSLRQKDLGLKYNNVTDAESLAPYFRQALAAQAKEALADLKKPDGSAWNLYTDGLKIHTTLDATMQRLAEESMETHMKELQKLFDEHWKKRKLWQQDEPGIRRAMEQSDRYKSLKAQGKTEEEIAAVFATPVPMRVFTWNGIEEREMRPIDSVIHHLSLLQAGLLAMDPQNGHIRAWVGGINHRFFKYDHVTARRQVGSTFKPFVYAAALGEGVNPCEYIPNQQVTYEGWRNWSPENADGHYEGYYTLTGGLVNSVNTVSAALIMRIGVDKAHQFASGFGFTSPLPKDPTLVLGTADLTLLEMVSAYTAFANSGQRAKPIMITRIEDSQGKVLVKFPVKPALAEAMPASTAGLMAQMLRSVVDSGTAGRLRRVYGVTGQWAGKTGTTQNQTDGWFIAFNPRLVVGAWVGGEERKVRFRSLSLGQGASTALPIAGRLLHRMSQYSAYKSIFTAQFEPVGPEWASQLNCPMFLPYDPAAQPDTIGGGGLQSLIDLLRARQEEKRRQRELEQENQPDVDFRYEYADPEAPAQEQPASKWQRLFKRKNRDDGGGQ
jgi:penicillin-binding protein 1A